MNKYLEKLAARKPSAQKTELEPGVTWNHNTKQLEVSKPRWEQEFNRKDSNSRLITGGLYGGMFGGLALGAATIDRRMQDKFDFGPQFNQEYDFDGYNTARQGARVEERAWKKAGSPMGVTNPFDKFYNTHGEGPWDSPTFKKTLQTYKGRPVLESLVNKIGGPKRAAQLAFGGGVGLATGALGYLVGGLNLPEEKKATKDAWLDKMERKHERRIDEIEGW